MASLGNEKYGYLIGCHLDVALNSRWAQFTLVSPNSKPTIQQLTYLTKSIQWSLAWMNLKYPLIFWILTYMVNAKP